MADLAAIRNALASTIQNNTTLPTTSQPLPATGIIPGQVNPPMAVIGPQRGQSIVFDTIDGGVTYKLVVKLIVAYTEDASTQGLLDNLLSTSEAGSVISAIEKNPRLGGAADWAACISVHGYGTLTWGDVTYFGADLMVDVAAHIP